MLIVLHSPSLFHEKLLIQNNHTQKYPLQSFQNSPMNINFVYETKCVYRILYLYPSHHSVYEISSSDIRSFFFLYLILLLLLLLDNDSSIQLIGAAQFSTQSKVQLLRCIGNLFHHLVLQPQSTFSSSLAVLQLVAVRQQQGGGADYQYQSPLRPYIMR